MSLIPNLSDIPNLAPVAPGEYDLRVIRAKNTNSKNTGRNGVLLVCEIVGEDNAENLMHTIWFGNDGKYTADDLDKSNLMWRMVKDFLCAVGLINRDEDREIELEDFEGLEFSAQLGLNDGTNENGDQVYAPRNELIRVT